jgi:hypothetical protein
MLKSGFLALLGMTGLERFLALLGMTRRLLAARGITGIFLTKVRSYGYGD